MTIRNYDANGRPVVNLGWGDRAVIGIIAALIIAAIGWMGRELVIMRDATRDEAAARQYDHSTIVDHEARIRAVEKEHK